MSKALLSVEAMHNSRLCSVAVDFETQREEKREREEEKVGERDEER